MDQLLVETMVGFTDDESTLGARPVATIAAPVFDEQGGVAMILAVHPLQALSRRRIDAVGRRIAQVTASISRQT